MKDYCGLRGKSTAQPVYTTMGVSDITYSDKTRAALTNSQPTFKPLEPASSIPEFTIEPAVEVPLEQRPPTAALPWVFTNMVTSLDGATSVDGLSASLGGPGDRIMFSALRSSTDAILVGAKTATSEMYRPAKPNRKGRRPTIVIVSSSLDLPLDLPLFSDPTYRAIVATTAQADQRLAQQLSQVADVQIHGQDKVDLAGLLRSLRREGYDQVLLEGGPRLNGQMIAQNLVNEWNLTISPALVGGESKRTSFGPQPKSTIDLDLKRLWLCDGVLFGRWVRAT